MHAPTLAPRTTTLHESRHTGEARLGRTHCSDEDSIRQGAGAARGNLRIPAKPDEALELGLGRVRVRVRVRLELGLGSSVV